MYQVFVIKPIFELSLHHCGYLRIFSDFISLVYSTPLPNTGVRVNSIETRMFKAPDYNEHLAVLTWLFTHAAAAVVTKYCDVLEAVAM